MFHLRTLSFVLFFVSLVFARSTATAQTLTWNGSAGGFLWNLDPNNQVWRNASLQNVGWTNGNDASFGGGFNTASVAAAIVAGTVTFSNSFTLEDGGGTLQASVFSVSNGFAVRINAVLAGTTGFTKTGGGRLELNTANTVSGTVNINQGGIDILAADALRNATVAVNAIGGIALATNANFGGLAGTSSFSLAQRFLTVGYNNLNTTFSGNLSGNHPNASATTFTKVGSGTLTITGDWSGLAGRREINGGFVAINGLTFLNELVTINGGGLRFDSDLTVSSVFSISRGGSTTFDTNGHSVSYLGSLAGNGAFTKTGAGTLTLVPTNFVATTDVSILGGTLFVNNKNNIGPFAADRTFTLDGGTFSDGINGGENFSSAVVLGSGGGTIEVRDPLGDLFFSGSFSGAGGLTKTGAGALQLGTAASYLGATTVTGGTLRTFAAATLPTNTALSVSNASVILDRAQSIGSLAGQSSTVEIKLGALSIGGNNTSTEFSGVLTGGGSVIKNGSGALILSGANTFSGALTLNAGTLTLSGSNTYALGTTVNGGSLISPAAGGLPGNSALTINGGSVDLSLLDLVFLRSLDSIAGTGGTLQLGNMQLTLTGNAATSYAGTILGGTAASLTKTGSGIFTLSGSTTVDEITINAGTLQLGNSGAVLADSGNVALGSTAALRLGAADETVGAVTGAGVVDLGSGAARTLKLNGTVETAFSYNGVIQGTGNLHLAFGSSSVTYTLGGTNTYGGTTFVESGELRTGTSGTVLPDATALGLGANGRLGLGSNETIGSLAGVSGSFVFLNGHTLTAGGTNLDSAFAGRLHGAGGLTKAGTGTLTLTGNSSTYTGTTTVNAGTLDAAGSGALGSGTTAVTSTGILLVSGANTNITNAVSNSGGLVRVFSGASASNVSVSNGGVAEVNGTIGTLALNGGTLRGGGTVTGGVTIDGGDILRPGNSAGQITVGNLTLGAGGRYVFELRDATGAVGVGYDSVLNLGALAITAGTTSGTQFTIAITTLNNSNQPGPASNFDSAQPFSFVLVQNASGVTGFDPARFTIDSTGFQNGLNGGSFALALSGNNLVLNFAPVPEPGTGILLAFALGGAAAIRFLRSRRRR